MAMNIKNEETQRLVHELSRANWGKPDWRRLRKPSASGWNEYGANRAPASRSRLIRIGKDCAANLPEPYRSVDHGGLLYDEKGLPR